MRAHCWCCSCYRLINYADRSSEIGCLQGGDDYPVAVRLMDACPKGCGKHIGKPVDKVSLLHLLGELYDITAVKPVHVSLMKYVSRTPTIAGKRSIAQKALQMVCLQKVSKVTSGKKGIACQYVWTAGVPSLMLAEQVIDTMNLLMAEQIERKRQVRKGVRQKATRKVRRVAPGATSCAKCRLKDVADCREKLLAVGYDCKKINVNKLEDEVTMGFTDAKGEV